MEYLNNLINNLSGQFGALLPGVLGAIVVLILGFLIARLVKGLTIRLMRKTSIDEKLANKLDTKFRIDQFVGKLLYYIVVIYTLLIVLNILGVDSVLAPLEAMLQDFLGFLPNVLAAGVIGYAGYMIASIASEASSFFTQKIESFSVVQNLKGSSINISSIVKQLVFIFVFIPILVVALDTLKMDAISQPATEMIGTFMLAIPKIISAIILLAVFYIAGKYFVGVLVSLLHNIGLDNLSESMGIQSILGTKKMTNIIGQICLFFIIFTGLIAAFDKLELTEINELLSVVYNIAGKVFFGILVLFGGVYVSNIAVSAISDTNDTKWLKHVVQVAIIGIFLSLSLHTMGIAENIVELAFGLTIGSLAVAFALAFGLGGREAAGKQVEIFFSKINNKR